MRCAMRLPRSPLAGVPQHASLRGHDRQSVFFRPDDDHVYLQCLHAAATYYSAVHACVWTTNWRRPRYDDNHY